MAPTRSPRPDGPAVLGVSWPASRPGALDDPESQVTRFVDAGFGLACLVPSYFYVGLQRIDGDRSPSFESQQAAVAAALGRGLQVVIKPHLDPPIYSAGYRLLAEDNHSWRAASPWRGYFDIDPLSDAYLRGVIMPTLAYLGALKTAGQLSASRPVRLDLGSELMNSTVYLPHRWRDLVPLVREEIVRLGLEGSVLLSHNFSHHFMLPEDFVLRMDDDDRAALRAYVVSLDAVAISQYMDLTVAVPTAERGRRMPTAEEVADALIAHERTLREDILEDLLGIALADQPALHVGEFGIGRGGLRHPNVWEGDANADEERSLLEQSAIGHRGLVAYAQRDVAPTLSGRQARSVILWMSGGRYDIFGWQRSEWGNPAAAAVYREAREAALQRSTAAER